METALSVRDICKTFEGKKGDTVEANKHISFDIQKGQIYGLLGPNGAGKSTLISIISGVALPNTGTVSIFGKDIVQETEAAKKLMGVVPQEMTIEMAFTVEEVLYYFSGMYGVPIPERSPRIQEVLGSLELLHKKDARARTLSGGEKRRLMIAKALLHKPNFLILDEPTAGVDVGLRQKIWSLVKNMREEGTTILFTTHYLEEAEQLCDYITLIDHGGIIKQGTVKDLQNEFAEQVIEFELYHENVEHLKRVERVRGEYQYPMTELDADMTAVIRHYGDNLKSIKSGTASLEQIFLKLTSTHNAGTADPARRIAHNA